MRSLKFRPDGQKRSNAVCVDEFIASTFFKRHITLVIWLLITFAVNATAQDPEPPCPLLVLQEDTVVSAEEHYSCEIRVGPDYVVSEIGDLMLFGTQVSFSDGFEVQDLGSLTVFSSWDSSAIYVDRVHPIWASQGCTACHTSSHPYLDLSQPTSSTCNTVRTGSAEGTQYLNESVCTSSGSLIISVPRTGKHPRGSDAHNGGSFACFANDGSSCSDAILDWCNAGAGCP